MSHPSWTPIDLDDPTIFDVYVVDFNATGKKTKMLFVSAEKSQANEVANLFKNIYDGTPKSYPNRSMVLFISLFDIQHSSPEFRDKIVFNHDKYIGDETLFSIGGFQDLKNEFTLSNGKVVTLQHLSKSIPASSGMFRPQLFQQDASKVFIDEIEGIWFGGAKKSKTG